MMKSSYGTYIRSLLRFLSGLNDIRNETLSIPPWTVFNRIGSWLRCVVNPFVLVTTSVQTTNKNRVVCFIFVINILFHSNVLQTIIIILYCTVQFGFKYRTMTFSNLIQSASEIGKIKKWNANKLFFQKCIWKFLSEDVNGRSTLQVKYGTVIVRISWIEVIVRRVSFSKKWRAVWETDKYRDFFFKNSNDYFQCYTVRYERYLILSLAAN